MRVLTSAQGVTHSTFMDSCLNANARRERPTHCTAHDGSAPAAPLPFIEYHVDMFLRARALNPRCMLFVQGDNAS